MRKLIAAVTAVSMMGITPAMAAEILWDQEASPYAAITQQQLEAQNQMNLAWEQFQKTIAAAQGIVVEGEGAIVEPGVMGGGEPVVFQDPAAAPVALAQAPVAPVPVQAPVAPVQAPVAVPVQAPVAPVQAPVAPVQAPVAVPVQAPVAPLDPTAGIWVPAGNQQQMTAALRACFAQLAGTVHYNNTPWPFNHSPLFVNVMNILAQVTALGQLNAAVPQLAAALAALNVQVGMKIVGGVLWIHYVSGNSITWLGIGFTPGQLAILPWNIENPAPYFILQVQTNTPNPTTTFNQTYTDVTAFANAWQAQIIAQALANGIRDLLNNLNRQR